MNIKKEILNFYRFVFMFKRGHPEQICFDSFRFQFSFQFDEICL